MLFARNTEDWTMASKLFLCTGLIAVYIGIVSCERQVSYANDVQPILNEYCAECHSQAGEGHAASGFSVADYNSVISGTKYGQVVIPGSSISSSLYLLIAQKTAPEIQMPPHHEESLSVGRRTALAEEKVEIIRAWIDQGAKDN
jgi:uncharacterized membrane protein